MGAICRTRPRVLAALALAGALTAGACSEGEFTRVEGNPAPVTATDVEWATNPAQASHEVLVGLVRAKSPKPQPLLILVPGTDGLSTTYVDVAHDFASRYELNVAFGCWFEPGPRPNPQSPQIDCPDAPELEGVQVNSLEALDAVVDGAVTLLGVPGTPVALFGFSRGGGLVALRAATGGEEVWINMSGLVEASTPLGTVPGETDVLDHLDGPTPPVLVLHGDEDGAVAPEQSYRLVEALRAVGTDVEEHYYPGAGHGLMMVPTIREDVEKRVAAFVHTHLDPMVGRETPVSTTTSHAPSTGSGVFGGSTRPGGPGG